MSPTELFIRRPVMTTLVSVGLLLFGIIGYFTLPTSDLPAVDYPTIQVTASLPGASPETMASAVATPLEREFTDISGLDSMSSNSILGQTTITLQFKLSRNIDAASQDVQAAISKAVLPSNLPQPPTYSKVNAADQPILYLSLSSASLPLTTVDTYADTFVSRRISMVDGVAQVLIYGEQKYAVRARLDPRLLASRGIGLDQIGDAISAQNVDLPTGTLEGEHKALTISAKGQLMKAKLYKPLIVAYQNNKPVRLGELGEVIDGVEQNKVAAWWRGNRSIVLAVKRQPGANTIAVVDAVRALFPEIRGQIPAAIKLDVLYDQSQSIRESVSDMKFTLVLAVALVVMVVFLFLRNLSATVITSLAVPMSLISTFIVMWGLGFSLDNISLMALTLSVGFVVDDAIVMLENVVRHMEMGKKPFQATLDGAKEIGFTIISMTLSLAVVFLPMAFMAGMVGRLLYEFAITICVAILLSGFVSLSLTPMLASRFLKQTKAHAAGKAEEGKDWLLSHYERALKFVLRHRPATMVAFGLMLAITGWLFMIMPKGFIPSEDRGMFVAYNLADQGISFESMSRHMLEVADIIVKDPAVDGAMPVVGAMGAMNSGVIFVLLKDRDHRKASPEEVIARLWPQVAQVPGIMTFMMNPPSIQVGAETGKAAYQYTLQAIESKVLYPAAQKLTQAMQGLDLVRDVSSDLMVNDPQVTINIDRDKAATLGVSASTIENALYSSYASREISRINASTDQYKVIVELLPRFQKQADDLRLVYVRSDQGKMVPLEVVTKRDLSLGPLQVNHAGQLPSVTISFNLKPGVSLSAATEAVKKLASQILPAAVTGRFMGTAQEFEKSMTSLVWLLVLALAVIYLILGILYESFIHPVTILAGLPSAAMGALVTLLIFGEELDLYAFVGIMMLIGIVKKNAIMMIDFALEAERKEGKSPEQSIVEGGLIRFRPIMMTTIAAFAGILPIAIGFGAGGDARRALGLAVCGGLIVSQLVTLLITPVIYTYFDELQNWLGRRSRDRAPETEIGKASA
jgi:HAE1 family hydrophobic/amphiphilic exporter-1